MNRKKFLASAAGLSALSIPGMAMTSRLAINPNEAASRPSELKITDIRGATVASIYDWPIIKIYTNQGIIGLGEVRDAGWISQALMMKSYLIGRNPLDIEAILRSISHLKGNPFEGNGRYAGGYSAIDIALMDIAGKALGVPCWKLLGDKVRDKIDVYSDTPTVSNSELTLMMKRRLDVGFRNYKIDLTPALLENIPEAVSGNLPTRKGLEIWGEHVLKAREIIGYENNLGADHFGFMTVESGIELGNFLADSKYGIDYIEDVIQYSRWNAINLNRKITEASRTPTLNGEDIFGLEGFRPWIDSNAIDIVHPDLLSAGGMIETKKIADYAYQFGVSTKFHCASSPVGTMANVHTAATVQEFTALECHAVEIPWFNDVVSGIPKPIIQKGGYIPVPDSPGLGIELNDEVLEKHLREPKYLAYKSGLFNTAPEFDNPITMVEAKAKGLIGGYHQTGGPWWHFNDKGEFVNEGGSN